MGYNPEPTKKRRFEVPISPGHSSKQRRAKKQYQPAANGINRALIDAGIVVATTLAVTVLLLGISGQISDTTAGNLIARSAAPLPDRIIPAQATPQLSLGAAPAASAQPTRSPTSVAGIVTPTSTPDDPLVQAAVEKKLRDDAGISALGITITVDHGQVVLVGTVPTDEMKDQVEKLVRTIKGVKQIDNQIVVSASP